MKSAYRSPRCSLPGTTILRRLLVVPILAPLAIFALLSVNRALAGDPASDAPVSAAVMEQFRKEPMSFFFDLRSAETLRCGQEVLKGTATFSPVERREALTAVAATYLASGKPAQARASVLAALSGDPQAELSRPETLPPPLVELFYGLRDSMLLAGGDLGTPSILTLALGDIENNSIVKGKYDMDNFAKGLNHILTTDLRAVTPFKLVDRARLAALRQEIEMSRSDQITDPRYAVPLGRLCGAQSFLFGSLMQTEGNRVRLDLRWVETSTSEILLSEGLEAKLSSSEDLFKLERKLMLEILAPKMEAYLTKNGEQGNIQDRAKPYLEQRGKAVGGGLAYMDFLLLSGKAMMAEEAGDMASARESWKKVDQLQPQDPLASLRVRALDAQLAMAQSGQE